MISIESIKFSCASWEETDRSADEINWLNHDQASYVTLHYFSKQPDIPYALTNLNQLRNSYREGATAAGGGIISMDVIQIKNLDCIEAILKFPKQPHGMNYMGALTFPFAQFSFVIKIQAEELGLTGLRESMVVAQLLETGELIMDPNEPQNVMQGWAEDPYDKSIKGSAALRNKSEDVKYDKDFPQHPLTRLRATISSIKETLLVSEDLYLAKKFTL